MNKLLCCACNHLGLKLVLKRFFYVFILIIRASRFKIYFCALSLDIYGENDQNIFRNLIYQN